jgi:hypothetical protein
LDTIIMYRFTKGSSNTIGTPKPLSTRFYKKNRLVS